MIKDMFDLLDTSYANLENLVCNIVIVIIMLQHTIMLEKDMWCRERIRRNENNAQNEAKYISKNRSNLVYFSMVAIVTLVGINSFVSVVLNYRHLNTINSIYVLLILLMVDPIIIAIHCIFAGKLQLKATIQCVLYVCVPFEISFIIAFYFKNNYKNIQTYVMVLYFIMWLLVSQLYKVWSGIVCVTDGLIIAFAMLVSFVVIINTMYNFNVDNWIKNVNICGVLLIDFLMVFAIVNGSKKRIKLKEHFENMQSEENRQQYMKKMFEEDEQLRRMRHDIKNQLDFVKSLMNDESTSNELAKNYLKQYNDRFMKLERLIDTDNAIVNAVVNSKLVKCSKENIRINTTIQNKLKRIDDIDMSSLIGNLLDNAIEAQEKVTVDKRYIEVNMLNDDDVLYISVKNTILESVLENNKQLHTIKADKKSHGLGTKIVKDIVEKYNGSIDYYEEDEFFCCDIRI